MSRPFFSFVLRNPVKPVLRLQMGSDTVSFYAVSPERQQYLRASLDAFSKALPAQVTVLRN
jgi:hypothetical protein